MTQVGYQPDGERVWWWRVAHHLDEAKLSLTNAIAHNLDDQKLPITLQDKLHEAQTILLEIFYAKHLLPSSMNGNGKAAVKETIQDAEIVPVEEPSAVEAVAASSSTESVESGDA